MIDSHLISNKYKWNDCFIENTPKTEKKTETELKKHPKPKKLVYAYHINFGKRGINVHIP